MQVVCLGLSTRLQHSCGTGALASGACTQSQRVIYGVIFTFL
jgi:hypothetical protein